MSAVELILRSIGFALLASIAFILLRTRSRDLKIQSAAWLAASVGAFLLTSMPGADRHLRRVRLPADRALLDASGVVLAVFAGAVLRPGDAAPQPRAVPDGDGARRACSISSPCRSMRARRVPACGRSASRSAPRLWSFACLAPLTVLLGYSGDLDSRRRRIRQWFVPGVSVVSRRRRDHAVRRAVHRPPDADRRSSCSMSS